MPFASLGSLAVLAVMVVCLPARLLLAGDLPAPSGPVLLTVSGAISVTNAHNTAHLDRDMLRALGETTISTTTIWTEGVQTFTGVPLARLMEALGANADCMLHAQAVNDYAVQIPPSDWTSAAPILAYERNGADMTLRTKGPLWLVYPFDQAFRYRSEVIYARSIWQLDRIVVGD